MIVSGLAGIYDRSSNENPRIARWYNPDPYRCLERKIRFILNAERIIVSGLTGIFSLRQLTFVTEFRVIEASIVTPINQTNIFREILRVSENDHGISMISALDFKTNASLRSEQNSPFVLCLVQDSCQQRSGRLNVRKLNGFFLEMPTNGLRSKCGLARRWRVCIFHWQNIFDSGLWHSTLNATSSLAFWMTLTLASVMASGTRSFIAMRTCVCTCRTASWHGEYRIRRCTGSAVSSDITRICFTILRGSRKEEMVWRFFNGAVL